MDSSCPICSKSFPSDQLELHVNSCLDTQEKNPAKSSQPITENDSTTTNNPKDVNNPFRALGLKMDSYEEKKNKAEKAGKSKPSLTSLLIAERRLKEQNRREAARILGKNEQTPPPPKRAKVSGSGADQSQDPNCSQDQPSSAPGSSPTTYSISSQIKLSPQVQTPPPSKYLEIVRLRQEAKIPLAQRLRPKSLDDFFGQEKLVGPNGLLRNMISAQEIPSFILWGVPGVGKTTLARIISHSTNYRFIEISGPSATAAKLREVFTSAENDRKLTGNRTLVFLDEIHRFNKAQQDLLLPVIEKGTITVLGATTENPSFTLNNALLSRMHTFVMESLSQEALVKVLNRGLFLLNQTRKLVHQLHLISLSRDAIDYIADLSAGDARVSLNILESINAYLSGSRFQPQAPQAPQAPQSLEPPEPPEQKLHEQKKFGVIKIDKNIIQPLLATRNYQKMYDHHGESHYDTISAFHKSVRGSDPDAAIFYLTKMLTGGEDPLFIARRMIVIASEDIGLRDSSCLPFAVAAKDALEFIGMPEGEIILAHCAVRLAKSPKSTKSYRALRTAQALFKENPEATSYKIPLHLRNAPTKLMKDMGYGDTYRYNPNFENGVVSQQYMPPELADVHFVDDKHLGENRDPQVSEEEYQKAQEDRRVYEEFKQKRKQVKELLIKEAMENPSDAEDIYDETCTVFPYDEFLSKEDQPEYFDGEEKDEYEGGEADIDDSYSDILPDLE